MTNLNELRELFDYNRWARNLILDAAAALQPDDLVRDMGSSFPSVRDTLVHIMSADWVWLNRWLGRSPDAMPAEWRTLPIDRIREQWRVIDEGMIRFIASLDERELGRTVVYRNIAGQQMSATLLQMLRHVINHSTYHRGQLTTMLRQLGVTPPCTDLILYYRTVSAAAV